MGAVCFGGFYFLGKKDEPSKKGKDKMATRPKISQFYRPLEYEEGAALYKMLQYNKMGVALQGCCCGSLVEGFYDLKNRSEGEWEATKRIVYDWANECKIRDPEREAYKLKPDFDWMPGYETPAEKEEREKQEALRREQARKRVEEARKKAKKAAV